MWRTPIAGSAVDPRGRGQRRSNAHGCADGTCSRSRFGAGACGLLHPRDSSVIHFVRHLRSGACSGAAAPFEARVRPRLNECYAAGKKKNPDLAGEIHIVVEVNPSGKVTSVKSVGTSELGASVVDCMVKAVKKEPFDGSACKGKTVAVGKTWGK